jgi:hypothetical protein
MNELSSPRRADTVLATPIWPVGEGDTITTGTGWSNWIRRDTRGNPTHQLLWWAPGSRGARVIESLYPSFYRNGAV